MSELKLDSLVLKSVVFGHVIGGVLPVNMQEPNLFAKSLCVLLVRDEQKVYWVRCI